MIDGTDGSGKATQVKLLVERLAKEKVRVKTIDFPRYEANTLGKLIREALDGKHGDFKGLDARIASVLYAADRYESSRDIRGWLERGYTVVADRYASSNQLHQGGKISDPGERKEFLGWLDHLEHSVFGIPRPDLIVYLHVPIEISTVLIERRAAVSGRALDQHEADTRHLSDAQASALSIVGEKNNWVKVDCSENGEILPRERIAEMIFEEVSDLL